jgi:hypothetical protein
MRCMVHCDEWLATAHACPGYVMHGKARPIVRKCGRLRASLQLSPTPVPTPTRTQVPYHSGAGMTSRTQQQKDV